MNRSSALIQACLATLVTTTCAVEWLDPMDAPSDRSDASALVAPEERDDFESQDDCICQPRSECDCGSEPEGRLDLAADFEEDVELPEDESGCGEAEGAHDPRYFELEPCFTSNFLLGYRLLGLLELRGGKIAVDLHFDVQEGGCMAPDATGYDISVELGVDVRGTECVLTSAHVSSKTWGQPDPFLEGEPQGVIHALVPFEFPPGFDLAADDANELFLTSELGEALRLEPRWARFYSDWSPEKRLVTREFMNREFDDDGVELAYAHQAREMLRLSQVWPLADDTQAEPDDMPEDANGAMDANEANEAVLGQRR